MTREEQEQMILENVPKVYEAGRGSIKNEVANALKGSASGEVVALKDVSPLEHGLGVRVSSKNLWKNQSSIYVEGNGENFTYVDERYNLPKGIYVFSCDVVIENLNMSSTGNAVYLGVTQEDGTVSYLSVVEDQTTSGKVVVAVNLLHSPLTNITLVRHNRFTSGTINITNIQLEKDTTTTAYTPFVPDVGAVKLRAQGANIINITEMLNNQLVDNGDGTYTLTKNGSSGLRFANWANINIPKGTKVAVNIDFIEIDLETTGTILGVQFMSDDGNIDTSINLAPQNVPRSFYFSTKNLTKARFFLSADKKDGDYVKFKNFQLEYGTANTEHEPYIEPVEYAVSDDGTVEGVKSIYPSTTLTTDTVGALIEVDYNRDINKAFEELHKVILSLGGIL